MQACRRVASSCQDHARAQPPGGSYTRRRSHARTRYPTFGRAPLSGEILFYSDFPFGYHNTEAEEKMARFAARGYRVHYVEQLGIRNPRPRHLLRVLRLLAPARPARAVPFDVVSPKLLAPRRAPLIASLNRAWLSRQLLTHVEDPRRTILWLRYPTPELLGLMESRPWRAVVYEEVDDHDHGPGMNDRLRTLFREARERVLSRADIVFAWSEQIREQLAPLHGNVRLATAAIDVDAFTSASRDAEPEARLVTYTGNIDWRFDAELVADVARRLIDWTFQLAGPADSAAVERLGGLQNVRLVGSLPPERVPPTLARATVCVMPYRQGPFADSLFPIKLVEYLAAGRPIVSTRMRAAEAFADDVAIASDADGFAAAIEAAAGSDTLEGRRRRAELARPFSWDVRIDEMQAAIEAVARDD